MALHDVKFMESLMATLLESSETTGTASTLLHRDDRAAGSKWGLTPHRVQPTLDEELDEAVLVP